MKLIPNTRARKGHDGGGYLISSNSDGFRDDEFVKERRSGTRRILLYGDSFTFGSGVAKDVRFGELIESSIPNTEVYNLALVGSGIDQQFLGHKFVGSNFDHDLILISPWVDLSLNDLFDTDRDIMLSPAWLASAADAYGGEDPARPACSPLNGDLTGLPPVLIQAGSDEILLNDSHRLCSALNDAGTPARLQVHPQRWHDFQLHAGVLADADQALMTCARFIHKHWKDVSA